MIKKTQNTVNVGKIIMKIPSTISKYATPLVKLKHFCKKKPQTETQSVFKQTFIYTRTYECNEKIRPRSLNLRKIIRTICQS